MTWLQDFGWADVGVGALLAAVNSLSLLASVRPERAARRGGPGYHKRAAAGSSVPRPELRSRLSWNLYLVALGLTLVTDYAFWSQVVLYVVLAVGAAVWLAPRVRRWRQNQLRGQ